MTEAHYIMWEYIQTEKGRAAQSLSPNDQPPRVALTDDDKVINAF
jgi:hypothetical protein